MLECEPRLRIERAKLRDESIDAVTPDTAQCREPGAVAGGEAIEVGKERLHRRRKPVPLRKLKLQALGKRAREGPGRRELLARAKHALDLGRRDAEARRDRVE